MQNKMEKYKAFNRVQPSFLAVLLSPNHNKEPEWVGWHSVIDVMTMLWAAWQSDLTQFLPQAINPSSLQKYPDQLLGPPNHLFKGILGIICW